MTAGPVARGILLVLDGWGHAQPSDVNALTTAHTPTLDKLRGAHASTLLDAAGEAVGLLPGTVGNSEIGHLVIGAGRPLPYDSVLVQRQIDSGQLRRNEALTAQCDRLAESRRALHLVGLCSDGQIHSHVEHLGPLLSVAAERHVPRVYIHMITDGRDVADGTAEIYLRQVQAMTAAARTGTVATVVGRGYAMDKAGNLTLTAQAATAIADGNGARFTSPQHALANTASDEWIPAAAITDPDGQPTGTVADGDTVLFFNFRSDRIQQLADSLVSHFAVTSRDVTVLSLAQYDTKAPIQALVSRADASGGIAHELARYGLRSVRIAEPEKFEHVTYYLNGRDGTERALEEHLRIDDGAAPDYQNRPQMRIAEVARAVEDTASRDDIALIVANLANIDVVGHTGDFRATVQAAEYTDQAVTRIVRAATHTGRWTILVGDHGNAELMAKPASDGTMRPYGGHTTGPVPFVVVSPSEGSPYRLTQPGGSLADVAPTILSLLGYPSASTMTGNPLV